MDGLYGELRTRTIDGIGGLVLVIAQDFETGEVLMAAYANKEALKRTVETGYAHYYSTSRGEIWFKGETSGNKQLVKEVWADCDGDALLYRIEQEGRKAACHEGYKSCFYRKLRDGELKIAKKRIFDPNDVYL